VVENTDRVLYLTLPPPPSEELSDEQLDAVAGGVPCDGGGLSCFHTCSAG
jgi:hypothetical protein